MKALALKNRARAAAEVLLFISLLIAAVLIAADKRYSDTVLSGIMLWAAAVLPSLFPYFFITAVLSSLSVTEKLAAKLSPFTRKVFNTGGITGYAFLMSLISGYPLGAKLVADLKENGLITRAESVRAAAFCSTSSPMFMISSVGSIMFKSAEFGLCLFLCHLLSAFAVGFIFSFYKRGEHPKACPPGGSPAGRADPGKNTDGIMFEAAFSAVFSVLKVGGLITLFYLFTEILYNIGVLSAPVRLITLIAGDENAAKGITFGLFECTKGLKWLSSCGANAFTLSAAAGICGFGGLSVIFQSLACLKKAQIPSAPFFAAKALACAVNVLVAVPAGIIFL